jgi:hypothetical protein
MIKDLFDSDSHAMKKKQEAIDVINACKMIDDYN